MSSSTTSCASSTEMKPSPAPVFAAVLSLLALAAACNHAAPSPSPSHEDEAPASDDAATTDEAAREPAPPPAESGQSPSPADAGIPDGPQPRVEAERCGVAKRHPRGAPAAAPEHMQPPAFEVRAGAGTLVRCDEALSLVEDFIATIRETMELRGWTCAWAEPGAEPAARCTSPDGEITFEPT